MLSLQIIIITLEDKHIKYLLIKHQVDVLLIKFPQRQVKHIVIICPNKSAEKFVEKWV